jgi:hypothetical protein
MAAAISVALLQMLGYHCNQTLENSLKHVVASFSGCCKVLLPGFGLGKFGCAIGDCHIENFPWLVPHKTRFRAAFKQPLDDQDGTDEQTRQL